MSKNLGYSLREDEKYRVCFVIVEASHPNLLSPVIDCPHRVA